MREYLFRGKRVDSGEWVYGYLSKHRNVFNRVYTKITPYDPIEGDAYVEDGAAVDPETVGEWMGLTDKNGTKIFEGDIITANIGECENEDEYLSNHKIVVKFDRGTFYPFSALHTWRGWVNDIEVIGNIYDNPELLEGNG